MRHIGMHRSSVRGRSAWIGGSALALLVTAQSFAGAVPASARDGSEIRAISVSRTGVKGDGYSTMPAVSADGRLVVFQVSATNLVPGIAPAPSGESATPQIYVRDVARGTTKLVSASPGGAPGDYASTSPTITPNGRYIAYYSAADNLVPGDTNNSTDIFLYDMRTGATTLASLARDGSEANHGVLQGYNQPPAVSDDGATVAFSSNSTNLVPDVGSISSSLVYVRDLRRRTTALVSATQAGVPADDFSQDEAVSGDGRLVAFSSLADNLVAGDTNKNFDVFVRDLCTGAVTRVSISSDGAQGTGSSSTQPVFSRDGTTIAFMSGADGLTSDGPANPAGDIFVRNLRTGTTVKASIGVNGVSGNGWSGSHFASLSGDGRYVAFQSLSSNLVSQPLSGGYHVFVRDLLHGTTRVVTTATDGTGGGGYAGMLSASGEYVAFYSWATDLVPGWTDGVNPQIYLREL